MVDRGDDRIFLTPSGTFPDGNGVRKTPQRRQKKPPGRPKKYHTREAQRKAGAGYSKAYRQRKKRSVHFKSDTDQWSTPEAVFQALDAEFHFTVDVCADASNAKCAVYFTPEVDGLKQRWTGICWMNPPYGKDIALWVQKAFESALWGTTVVCLLPARTDTQWWQRYVLPLPEDCRRYLPGRLKFGGAANGAPFPSAVVIFRARPGD